MARQEGYFLGTPVCSSTDSSRLCKFDPYTKCNLGRLPACPPGTCGCGIIPDSNYIVGFGRDTGFVKLDSFGSLLYAGPGSGYGRTDLDLLVPEFPTRHVQDTVCFYVMNSHSMNYFQRVSAGMLWSQIPGWQKTVFPTEILAPGLVVDSGDVITPRIVIRSASLDPVDSIDVHFLIGDEADRVLYHDSTYVLNLPARGVDTVEFSAWTVAGRDSLNAVCWTSWTGDSTPEDDTIAQRFLVRAMDVFLAEVYAPIPGDTLDPGNVWSRVLVRNRGNLTATFPMVFNIGVYTDTVWVGDLIAGGSRTVTAANPWDAIPGNWYGRFKALVEHDLHPGNNDTTFLLHVRGTIEHDVAVVSIDVPSGVIDTTPFIPRVTVRNQGAHAETFRALFWMEDTSMDAVVYAESVLAELPAGIQTVLVFPQTRLAVEGPYTANCSCHLSIDQNWLNNSRHEGFRVGRQRLIDVAVDRVLAPAGRIDTGSVVVPSAVWRNNGTEPVDFRAWLRIEDSVGARLYDASAEVAGLSGDTILRFVEYNVGTAEGRFRVVCSSFAYGDTRHANDTVSAGFQVATGPGGPGGWSEVASMPDAPSGKTVKRGGWLALDPGSGLIYAGKGHKTTDFYRYDPWADRWAPLSGMPFERGAWPKKPPRKGSKGVCDDEGRVYVTQGNNTLGFWGYDISSDSWVMLADVPEGSRRKKVKGGTDLVYVPPQMESDTGFVYLLKGYKTEFYRYNTRGNEWQVLPDAPAGSRAKWDKGSWLTFDHGQRLYAHKAKYHELWSFDLSGLSWSTERLAGLPFIHPLVGRKKKSKDGGCADWTGSQILALKGGNTGELWGYLPGQDTWVAMDTMPSHGSTGRKRRVKYGADLVCPSSDICFALKGNKTLETWRYVLPGAFGPAPVRSGVAGGVTRTPDTWLAVTPSCAAAGGVLVEYALPRCGPVDMAVLDPAGRSVRALARGQHGAGIHRLVWHREDDTGRRVGRGVYYIRLESGDLFASRKVVMLE